MEHVTAIQNVIRNLDQLMVTALRASGCAVPSCKIIIFTAFLPVWFYFWLTLTQFWLIWSHHLFEKSKEQHLYSRVSSCSSTVTNNCTYIQNPSYPSSYSTSGSCEYNITPLSSDICQLRLDMDNMDLTDTDGACTDSFEVTSSSSRVYPTLCGTLSGQHSK